MTAPAGARLALWPTAPHDTRSTPPPDAAGVLFSTTAFALGDTGNRTLDVPKRSWRATLTVDPDGERFLGLARINLKAMYNDPSQMREALAWRAFAEAGVPASRHTYAKLTINGRYRGLFSVVEDVDRRYLSDRFGDAAEGNLYKAGCGTLGCATLERRVGPDGDDSGRQYRVEGDDPTYDLHAGSSGTTGYDDLAALIRAVDGTGLPGGDGRFATDAYRAGLEKVFDTRTFLRWAGVNILLGSWDNYFATPSNYYLYNSAARRTAVVHVPAVGLRQQLRYRLRRRGVAVRRHRRLARRHRALPRPQPRPAPALPDSLGDQPPAPPGATALLPRPPGAPARHDVRARHRDRADRARRRRPVGSRPGGRLPGVRHATRAAAHRPPVHQRRPVPGQRQAVRAAPGGGEHPGGHALCADAS